MPHRDISLWRIAKQTLVNEATDLSGDGASMMGGRWNSKGKAIVYGASSVALATLETLVHLGGNIAIRNAFLVQITVPASGWAKREVVLPSELHPTWLADPPGPATIRFGNEWLESRRSPLLLVPSVIVPEEFVVLINPAHPGSAAISAIVARQFLYDPRLSP